MRRVIRRLLWVKAVVKVATILAGAAGLYGVMLPRYGWMITLCAGFVIATGTSILMD